MERVWGECGKRTVVLEGCWEGCGKRAERNGKGVVTVRGECVRARVLALAPSVAAASGESRKPFHRPRPAPDARASLESRKTRNRHQPLARRSERAARCAEVGRLCSFVRMGSDTASSLSPALPLFPRASPALPQSVA
eukprot:2861507-Rhodomonas_salina.2